MRNFCKIATGLDIDPLKAALLTHSDLWDRNSLRTKHENTVHAQVSDIWVWFNKLDEDNHGAVIDDVFVIPYAAWYFIPQVRPVIFDLMRLVGGIQLGRAMITRLPPDGRILPHADNGAPATFFERYHIALQGDKSSFRVGKESVEMQPGEAWWFNNCLEHEVHNAGEEDRIVMIVDIRVS